MPPVGFELTISAGVRPKTYALDRAATGTGYYAGYSGVWTRMNRNVPRYKVWLLNKEIIKHVNDIIPTRCALQGTSYTRPRTDTHSLSASYNKSQEDALFLNFILVPSWPR